MHNIKDIRLNPNQFKEDLSKRFTDIKLEIILSLDENNRKLIQKKEALEKEKKDISKIVYYMKKDKKNTNEKINLILLEKIGKTTKPKKITLRSQEVKKFLYSLF